MMKYTQFRPAKKFIFDSKPGMTDRRALLSDHLGAVRLNEELRKSAMNLRLKEEK